MAGGKSELMGIGKKILLEIVSLSFRYVKLQVFSVHTIFTWLYIFRRMALWVLSLALCSLSSLNVLPLNSVKAV